MDTSADTTKAVALLLGDASAKDLRVAVLAYLEGNENAGRGHSIRAIAASIGQSRNQRRVSAAIGVLVRNGAVEACGVVGGHYAYADAPKLYRAVGQLMHHEKPSTRV